MTHLVYTDERYATFELTPDPDAPWRTLTPYGGVRDIETARRFVTKIMPCVVIMFGGGEIKEVYQYSVKASIGDAIRTANIGESKAYITWYKARARLKALLDISGNLTS